jgi:hypothetical protein
MPKTIDRKQLSYSIAWKEGRENFASIEELLGVTVPGIEWATTTRQPCRMTTGVHVMEVLSGLSG